MERGADAAGAQAIDEIAAAAVAELAAAYPPGDLVRRAAHAKAHGCLRATFRVDPNLPPDLRIATFAHPGESFRVLMRLSNSAFRPGPDGAPNGRGLAIKILDAAPEGGPPRGRPPHDLLFINYPNYFLADLADFLAFARAGGVRGDTEHARAYFFPSWNPFLWRPRQAWIVFRNATRPMESPLRGDYHSMTPYAFGASGAVKFAARPCAAAEAPGKTPDDPDYLRKAMERELSKSPACFELLAQKSRPGGALDDATQEWTTPLQLLGRIDIPAQKPAAGALCENLSFNPANAPAELAPLGGINAARARLYEASRAYRMSRNGATPTDPLAAWDSLNVQP